MRQRAFFHQRVSNDAYIELVRSLFATLAPTTIMGILFVVVATMTVRRHFDMALASLAIIGTAVSLLRVTVTIGFEKRVFDPAIDIMAARRIERIFGGAYLTFAITLGLFAGRALHVSDPGIQMVIAALVVGYAAGAAAGVSLRPWIGVPAVLLAVLPPALTAAATPDPVYSVLALVFIALLAGGIGSMLARYRSEIEKLAMRQAFASLARQDYLTGLANRLALDEAFKHAIAERGPDAIAVHCLDLDRFKPVNDQFGHLAGDALLVEVADRLRFLCREGDVAARLGGDEFMLLQTRVGHADEAQFMARRIVRAIAQPYFVNGCSITIGVSVGYAIAKDCGPDLHRLLGCADAALYRIKRDGGGAAASAEEQDIAVAAMERAAARWS